MKAVVLTAGKGTRLRPITSSRPKPLIPIAGKPLLEHTILSLKDAGIDHILLVVGYKEDMIKDYFKDGKEKFDLAIDYVTQEEFLGTAHATGYAKEFVGNDEFLLMYGDLLIEPLVFKEVVEEFKSKQVNGMIALREVDNPQHYGIISLDDANNVTKIVEKPPPELDIGNLANAGVFIFDSQIFKAIEKTEKSIRGEYEFTDSMEILINELGGKIFGYKIDPSYYWSDIGLPWQFLDANGYLLSKNEPQLNGKISKNVDITGNVFVGESTEVKSGTVIQGPCYIGNNCLIGPNAFIRPNTFISDGCHVGLSEVKNSIVLENSNVPHFNYIGDSIICENVNLGAGTKVANLRFDDQSVLVTIKGKRVNSGRRKLGSIIGPNVKTGINASLMCGKILGENSRVGAHTLIMEDVPPNTLVYNDPKKGLIKKELTL